MDRALVSFDEIADKQSDMSTLPAKEERVTLLSPALEENAGAEAAQTYQPSALMTHPTAEHPQYVNPDMAVMQTDQPMYYYVPNMNYAYQQLTAPEPCHVGHHPQGVPMTPCDGGSSISSLIPPGKCAVIVEDPDRRDLRLFRNRVAAKKSRERKKHSQELMRMRLQELEAEVKRLREKVSYLMQANTTHGGVPTLGCLPTYVGQ